ncbi:hypothetical protein BJV82DRAFT_78404 [Fennellomyces sp. T-0311]|nr:hypothetical protein BJV82DRAFT_78404 [Fennellomyces sp. T-0311]
MDSLEYLLQDPNSPLTRVDMKALNQEIFDKLQIDALESLGELLPPADLVLIRQKPHGPVGDRFEVITPQSIDQVNELSKHEWCTPHISPRVFENSDYRSHLEDFLVLVSEGHYLPEEEDDLLEAPPSPADAKRKRKRKSSVDQDENMFKDEGYERYWGERLQKQAKKPRGRRPKA